MTDAAFDAATAPLWTWYDALRPNLWRGAETYPANHSVQQQLLNDGEVNIAMSFDPASTAAAIAQGLLPETARVFVPDVATSALSPYLTDGPCRGGRGSREPFVRSGDASPYAAY